MGSELDPLETEPGFRAWEEIKLKGEDPDSALAVYTFYISLYIYIYKKLYILLYICTFCIK